MKAIIVIALIILAIVLVTDWQEYERSTQIFGWECESVVGGHWPRGMIQVLYPYRPLIWHNLYPELPSGRPVER